MTDTPENVAVSAGCDDWSLTLDWDEPAVFAWTEVSTEIERTDCEGTATVAVIEGAFGSWCDRTVPLTFPGRCDPGETCEITYRLRYVGLDGGEPATGDWTTATGAESVAGERGTSYLYAGGVTIAVCPEESFAKTRPFQSSTPENGGIPQVSTGPSGGREATLGIASVVGRDARDALAALLAEPYVHYRPAARPGRWYAPHDEQVVLVQNPKVWKTTVVLTPARTQVQSA